MDVARNDWAERQKGYLSSHRSLYSTDFFHWTETQEPFYLRQQHQGEESLAKAKIFNLKVITRMKCNGNSTVSKLPSMIYVV